jgi:hypothetical protein
MKLIYHQVTLIVDTTKVDDPDPQTQAERVVFVRDAIAEINSRLSEDGIYLNSCVEANDHIGVED